MTADSPHDHQVSADSSEFLLDTLNNQLLSSWLEKNDPNLNKVLSYLAEKQEVACGLNCSRKVST